MVGMFQKEVADRIIAGPGSKTYGILSVLAQAHYKGEMIVHVSRGSFNPPPNVSSAVIRLTRLADEPTGYDSRLFRQVVKQSFGQRRKMLRNTVKSLVSDVSQLPEDVLRQRPEQLSVNEFIDLTNKIQALQEKES